MRANKSDPGSYVTIRIEGDQFSVSRSKFKPKESALQTLKRIEQIMEKNLKAENDGEFSGLSSEQQALRLKQIAGRIKAGFHEKASHASVFARWFGGVSKEEKAINTVYDHIENLYDHIENLADPSLPALKQGRALLIKAGVLPKPQSDEKSLSAAAFDKIDLKKFRKELFRIAEKGNARDLDALLAVRDSINMAVNDKKIEFSTKKLWEYVFRNPKNAELVKVLLDRGVDLNAKDPLNNTPIMVAIKAKAEPKVIQMLLVKGADVESKNLFNSTALVGALKESYPFEIIKQLVDKGSDVNATTNHGMTPLMFVLKSHLDLETIEFLLEKGAYTSVENADGESVVDLANKYKASPPIIELIADHLDEFEM